MGFFPNHGSAQHVAEGVVGEHNEINVEVVALGWSVTQLLRGRVYNEKEQFIGYVHDAFVLPNGETSFVIVNVAGFLNLGSKLVALPVEAFSVTSESNLLLPGATEESLKSLPTFIYP